MKKINLNDFDVVVIQKQTALERYTRRNINIDFLDYLSQDIQNKDKLDSAHKEHVESRRVLLEKLNQLNLSFVLLNLDELKENQLSFFSENSLLSGIRPKKKVVISLGGDGTLLHASHHVGEDIQLLGINSCPDHSVGHLCAAVSKKTDEILEKVFVDKKVRTQLVNRLRVKLKDHENIPLALNDILVSHLHPAATSRYKISILDESHKVTQVEKHFSSGLWISTAAGSTAAIASYGFLPEPLDSTKILVACREPYALNGHANELNKFSIDGQSQSLCLFSRMRQGLVCLDGPDFSVQFGFGETIDVSSPKNAALNLIY